MKFKMLVTLFIFIVTGCVTKSAPLNNADFESGLTISDLQGTYRNKGDAGDTGYDIYLSRIIWPNDTEIAHEKIDRLKVTQLKSSAIIVTALSDGQTVKEGQFLLERDFSFEKGRITINREGGVAGLKSGEPILGLYYGNVTIGLDKNGHGKFRSSGAAVGMAYMVVPLAIKAQKDVRFERIE